MQTHRTVRLICALVAAGFAAAPASAEDAGQGVVRVAAPAAETALAPEAAAFRAALRGEIADLPEAQRAAIDGFYAGRDYAPFWTEPGSPRAEQLVAAMEEAGAQALPLRRYDAGALAQLLGAEAPEAMREVAATRSFLRLAGDLAGGALVPVEVDPEINVKPQRPAPAALLARLAAAPVPEVLAGLEPADPDYRRLVAEKTRLEALLRSESWGPGVAGGPTLHAGETGPRIAELRARLARLGYDALAEVAAPDVFDPGLERVVQAFQRDHGLVDDGVVGSRTLAAVNAPVETRLAQVVVNLERLRWMDADPGPRQILVNIPDYSVTLYEDGRAAWQTRAVVGKATDTRTPEFSDVISYFVVNPTWHIPDSIAKRVYLPKLKADPNVLANSNMRLFTRAGTEINPKLVDFTQYTTANFPFRVKQRPSAENALGRVKFMFPNQFSIYLHDTPLRELFAKDERAFSNGCIRLEQPLELAHILLEGQVDDPAAAFDGWVAAKSERSVTLDRPIPVTITYRTVWFDATGTARYRADVYGRDATVFEALEAAGVTLPAAQG